MDDRKFNRLVDGFRGYRLTQEQFDFIVNVILKPCLEPKAK